MTNQEFRAWLQGFFDLIPEHEMTRQRLFIIGNHLNLVKSVEGELDSCNRRIFQLVDHAFKNSPGERENTVIAVGDETDAFPISGFI